MSERMETKTFPAVLAAIAGPFSFAAGGRREAEA